jgi:uncharacterized membrane protein YeaQ/YmgE (transglycosylase-associated protein family)
MGTLVVLGLAVLGIMALFSLVGSVVKVAIAVLVWGITGWLASRLMGGDGAGPVVNVLLGVVGGVVGGFVLRLFSLGWVSGIVLVGDILVGIVGAVIIIFLVRQFTGNKGFAR